MTRVAMVVSGGVSEGAGSGGGTGGAVLEESTRATRAAPPGETKVYPRYVTSNTTRSGIPGARPNLGSRSRRCCPDRGNARAGSDHICGMWKPV
jgi:hypothetical protein